MTQGLFDAFYLPPGLERGAETTVQRFGPAHDSIELRLATVTPASIVTWIDALVAAREELLARKPAAEIHRVLEPGGRLLLTVPFGQPGQTSWYRVYDKARLDRLLASFAVKLPMWPAIRA